MGKEAKTNAMRMLDRAKVNYTSHEYPHEEGQAVDGAHVAQLTGQDPAKVFKTLVTQGADRNYYVFVVPGPAHHPGFRRADRHPDRMRPGRPC